MSNGKFSENIFKKADININDMLIIEPSGEMIKGKEGIKRIHIEQDIETLEKRFSEKKLELEKIEREAEKKAAGLKEELIKEAEKEKEEILNRAQAEKTEVLNQAREEGRQEGIVKGETEAKNEFFKIVEEAKTIILRAHEEKIKIIDSHKKDIVDIAVSIAEKIIKDNVSVNKEFIINNLSNAISNVKEIHKITVHINPNQKQKVSDWLKEKYGSDFKSGIKILLDENLEDGSVKIDTEFGVIDATIKSQIENIKEKLSDITNES